MWCGVVLYRVGWGWLGWAGAIYGFLALQCQTLVRQESGGPSHNVQCNVNRDSLFCGTQCHPPPPPPVHRGEGNPGSPHPYTVPLGAGTCQRVSAKGVCNNLPIAGTKFCQLHLCPKCQSHEKESTAACCHWCAGVSDGVLLLAFCGIGLGHTGQRLCAGHRCRPPPPPLRDDITRVCTLHSGGVHSV